ncbi:hypothetical protein VFPPC_16344 [Pochonia chlamydosporia 170]|uniref:Uncharacterized protein n=1 Tax=Pochonia chlamydosporia 170 TaxID=1380566 RepID=A0A179FJB9_METCM|nr:hypothetical protein VFPPC_16344 [Pochonia chlamydosporia 170]OAQ65398.1 hypothetical protein VFPPC_16344 [Pochonia chlamydosporia 170]
MLVMGVVEGGSGSVLSACGGRAWWRKRFVEIWFEAAEQGNLPSLPHSTRCCPTKLGDEKVSCPTYSVQFAELKLTNHNHTRLPILCRIHVHAVQPRAVFVLAAPLTAVSETHVSSV